MDLIAKLNLLGQEVNEKFPEINYGGCCVFAAMVASHLVKLGISARGIVASHDATNQTKPISKIRTKLKNNRIAEWQDNGVSFSHVGVEFNYKGHLYHYDSHGVRSKSKFLSDMPIYRGRMKPIEMKILADSKEGWNETFLRRQIPQVRRIVERHLKDVTVVA